MPLGYGLPCAGASRSRSSWPTFYWSPRLSSSGAACALLASPHLHFLGPFATTLRNALRWGPVVVGLALLYAALYFSAIFTLSRRELAAVGGAIRSVAIGVTERITGPGGPPPQQGGLDP